MGYKLLALLSFIFALLLIQASVQAVVPVEVIRTIPAVFAPGQPADITLSIDVDEMNLPVAFGIEETIPAGWEVSSMSYPNYSKYEPNTNKIGWLFWEGGNPVQDTTITYTVIPNSASGRFTGIWMTATGNGSIEYPRIDVDSCRELTRAGTVYRLNKSLSSGASCLTIGAGNIILDLNGYSITGPNNWNVNYKGVMSYGHDNIVIRNGNINNFGFGISLSSNRNNLIENITVNSTFYAIAFAGSSGNTVRNVNLHSNTRGLFAHGWKNNNVRDSVFYDNSEVDVLIYGHEPDNSINDTFLNCSYSLTKVHVARTCELTRKWYYRVHVEDGDGSDVEGAEVNAYNSSGYLVESLTTGSDGWAEGSLIDYTAVWAYSAPARTYYSPYTITVSYSDYTASHTYNVIAGEVNLDTFTLGLIVQSESMSVEKNQVTTFDFGHEHEDLVIRSTDITPEDDFTGTTVIIAQNIMDGELFKIEGTDKTYALINISFVSGIEDLGHNIISATINFRVPKTWISSNNIDPNTVKMYILESSWTPLPTTMTGSDANYYHYQAVTTHLSPDFAITGSVFAGMAGAPGFDPNLIIAVIAIVLVFTVVWFGKKRKRL